MLRREMPGSDSTGISRKVEQEGERKKLKEFVAGMNIPAGIGYIIRTEAVGRSQEELQKDLENLLAMYDNIKKSAAEINGAGEVYQDRGLIIRTIRDYFSDDIDEVLVDSKEAYREAKEFFRETMPKCEKLVKLHKEILGKAKLSTDAKANDQVTRRDKPDADQAVGRIVCQEFLGGVLKHYYRNAA